MKKKRNSLVETIYSKRNTLMSQLSKFCQIKKIVKFRIKKITNLVNVELKLKRKRKNINFGMII